MKGVIKIGFFRKRKKQEIRADTGANNEVSILTFFGITGELTREAALSIPTVSACINKIGETISRLPVKLYRRDEEQVTEIFDDSRLKLLNGNTGDTLSTVDMWKAAVEDYYLGSGAWIFVNSDMLRVRSLHYIDSRNVSIMCNTDPIFKAFRVQVNAQMYYDFQFIKLLRKTRDGYTNIPLQEEASSVMSAAWNALKLENMMNSNGGCKPGFLKAKNRLSDAAIAAIKEGYREVYDNEQKRDKIVVLNDGVDFEAISSTAAELQMNENKKTNSIEICKLFGFPHTVIDGGASDDDNKKFISAVIALLNQIETELDNVLLLESEKEQGYYWAFDTKELTRGSMKERYDAYEVAVRNNILQIDEIRREEDYEPLGFNFIKLGLQDVLLNPETMEVYTPNTGQTKNLLTGEDRAEDIELRYRQYIQGPDGKMQGSRSVGGGGGRKLYHHDPDTGGGGGKSAKKVDKSEKSGKIEKRPKSQKIGTKEKTRLEHQIASDFPNLKPGQSMNYENRNHFYQFTTIETGKYHFTYKIALEGNQDVINKIRKGEL
ncbi:MAG: phage portal protein [Ruminococcus sp.]|nr:phage portal protein [Ruminococcus sp.]